RERGELTENHQAERSTLSQTITNLTEQNEQKQTKINQLN
ncbi:12450_t:CDS:1, partial [Entrophospora sp. SA101]